MERTLFSVSEADFQYLIRKCVFSATDRARLIDFLWSRLPTDVQKAYDSYRFCLVHYNRGNEQVDGPASLKFACAQCQQQCSRLF